jgi:hypothetical protein
VPDMDTLGYALCLRWAWLARVVPCRAWTALPCKGDRIEQALFDASVSVVVGSGEST